MRKKLSGEAWLNVFIFGALGLAVAGAIIWALWLVGYAILVWMRDGFWFVPSNEALLGLVGIDELRLGWVGLDRVLQWFLGLPGVIGLLVVAWGLGLVLNSLGQDTPQHGD